MFRRLLHLALALVVLSATAGSIATADPITPPAALARVLSAPAQNPDWYTTQMLAAVPLPQMDAIVGSIRSQLGTFMKVTGDGSGGNYVAVFSGGTIACWIRLDAGGKIDGIFFKPPSPTAASLADAVSRFGTLHGTVSYLVTQDGEERAAAGQSTALGVGSTFKLAILNALQAQIRAGKRHWSDAVPLRNAWKSLPSGFLQTWPDGSSVTLETLASLMISISDNTAADTLLHVLGRPAVEAYGATNVPFLSTHDMFALKTKGAAAARARWRAAGIADRRRMLPSLDAAQLSLDGMDLSPAYDDIEWHFTNRQLCALMKNVRALRLFGINPGLADASEWKSVAFKGGSDAGVLSMTTWLTAKNGRQFCVSATVNDATAAVDEKGFTTAYRTVIDRLRDEAAKP